MIETLSLLAKCNQLKRQGTSIRRTPNLKNRTTRRRTSSLDPSRSSHRTTPTGEINRDQPTKAKEEVETEEEEATEETEETEEEAEEEEEEVDLVFPSQLRGQLDPWKSTSRIDPNLKDAKTSDQLLFVCVDHFEAQTLNGGSHYSLINQVWGYNPL